MKLTKIYKINKNEISYYSSDIKESVEIQNKITNLINTHLLNISTNDKPSLVELNIYNDINEFTFDAMSYNYESIANIVKDMKPKYQDLARIESYVTTKYVVNDNDSIIHCVERNTFSHDAIISFNVSLLCILLEKDLRTPTNLHKVLKSMGFSSQGIDLYKTPKEMVNDNQYYFKFNVKTKLWNSEIKDYENLDMDGIEEQVKQEIEYFNKFIKTFIENNKKYLQNLY